MKASRFLLAIRRKWLSEATSRLVEINGQPSIIYSLNGCIFSALMFDIVDGRIDSISIYNAQFRKINAN
ncbi:hypothetical protein [Leptolyngbya sp. FACHB-261]|uniref:hypothetical protein n=1 Tax=Leptolyngbya sp. FACHB-261 TaxID=2692806 RepID=UPI00168A2B2B|nr:hypothetical protein [Leptolyngbya sp. FACHB-261]MBD2102415.1 hypothetical protein [Leptolyngbya sp. FACHB-261]